MELGGKRGTCGPFYVSWLQDLVKEHLLLEGGLSQVLQSVPGKCGLPPKASLPLPLPFQSLLWL